jgi:hypothetical protein
MKKLVLFCAMLGSLVYVGAASASDPIIISQTGQEGCVSPSGDTCTYTSTRDGGYASNGTGWTLTVQIAANGDPRDTNLDGKLRYVFTASNAPQQGCGLWGANATVTTSAGAARALAAGNPFPAATDPVAGGANDCATGLITPGNPNYTPVD